MTPEPRRDVRWMRRALALAARGRGTTSPNPMVGAVLVRGDEVIGEGFHARAGEPHAEVHALREAGEAAAGAELFVTLEPCCHHGRTGPCSDAVLAAGVRRVVVGAVDPNPRVAGGGIERLRSAGVEVVSGVLGDEAAELNATFNHWITTGRPRVVLKLATSLDGRIAARTGKSRWITGPEARARVHALRAELDGVLVGARTALADDPRLTVRDAEAPGGDPVRVLVDSRLEVPPDARLFDPNPRGVVVATAVPADGDQAAALRARGAEVWSLPGPEGRVDLGALLRRLGARAPRPLISLLVEGGGGLAAGLMAAGLVDELRLMIAPLVIGGDGVPAVADLGLDGPADGPRWEIVHVTRLGADVELVARPRRDDEEV